MTVEAFKTAGAVALGLLLAALPFLIFTTGHGHGVAPHADHSPHFGGQLSMVGDHHLELVRKNGRLHVYASDALRRPVVPVGGTVSFDTGELIVMRRERFSLSAPDRRGAREVTCTVQLTNGAALESNFTLAAAALAPR